MAVAEVAPQKAPQLNLSNNSIHWGFAHTLSPWFSGKLPQMKGNDPIGDTPIFHSTMIMGGRVSP